MKIKKGNKVLIKGTDSTAVVSKVSKDGIIHIILDNPAGSRLRIHQSSLKVVGDSSPSVPDDTTILNASPSDSTTVPEVFPSAPTTVPETSPSAPTTVPEASPSGHTTTTVPAASAAAISTQPRGEDGRFSPGGTHPYYPANPANRERVATARSLRQSLLTGMADLVDDLPGIIGSIHDPDKKANAINQTLKIILPQYSSIKFSDAPPRILTAEQELAELKRKFKESQK